jgi:formyl-CoA transferase
MVACVLGDLGCDVVHVDLPGSPGGTNFPPAIPGTTLSWAHQTVNRNKRSITVDLHRPEGIALLLELVAVTDVVVQNFKPGTLAAWGIGYDDCRAVKPDIVYVSVSGYGQFGPWSPRPGYDPAALATSGWMSLNGAVDGPPNKAPTFLADDLAGLHGVIGAISALHHRNATGEGQHVDVALLDAILFQSNGLLTLGAMDAPLARLGNRVGPTSPCNSYECADGTYVYLAIALDSHWRRWTEVMGCPELASAPGMTTNAERVQNRDACDRVMAEWCRGRSRAEVLDAAEGAGVVGAPVETYHSAARAPHVQERDMLVPTVLSDGTPAPITGPAAKFSRTPTTVRSAAPTVGAHTDEVFREIGVEPERLAALRDAGVI